MTHRKELAAYLLGITKSLKDELPSHVVLVRLDRTQLEMAGTALLAVDAMEAALEKNRP